MRKDGFVEKCPVGFEHFCRQVIDKVGGDRIYGLVVLFALPGKKTFFEHNLLLDVFDGDVVVGAGILAGGCKEFIYTARYWPTLDAEPLLL